MADGHKSGHDNFNYVVTTWEHRFSKKVHTKTEAYYMWQFDAVVGGTPSLGPPHVVRRRRRSRQVHPGHIAHLRHLELHHVPALEERLLHGPQ